MAQFVAEKERYHRETAETHELALANGASRGIAAGPAARLTRARTLVLGPAYDSLGGTADAV